MPLPNATALLLNASRRAYKSARHLRDDAGFDKSLYVEVGFQKDQDVFDYIEHMIEATVLAFTALEAFVNEFIPDEYVYSRRNKDKDEPEALSKQMIERRVPIDEKLVTVLPDIVGCASPKGSRCWQSYPQLKNARDRLIHMKSEDRRSSGVELETIWKVLFLLPSPHNTAVSVINHFVKAMAQQPFWHANLFAGEG